MFNVSRFVVVYLHTQMQRTILRALRYLLSGHPDDDTYDVSKNVDLLMPDQFMFRYA